MGILQARILEWVAIPFPRGSSQTKDWVWVSSGSCIAGGLFTIWAAREALKQMEKDVKNFVKLSKNNSFYYFT